MTVAVSVITPTKNRLALLCQTMDSVQRQSLTDWEHVIVDDGSNDGTEEEVRKRAAADPRIRLIRRTGTKTGANVCRNIGIRESRADLIVLLDSDDFLRSECLERRVKLMRRNADLDFSVFRAGVYSKKLGDMDRLFTSTRMATTCFGSSRTNACGKLQGPFGARIFSKKSAEFDATDPRIVPKARRLEKIAFEEMLEMASLGAKVLQTRSVEIAMLHRVPTRVLSTFTPDVGGTLLCDEEDIVEKKPVTGIAYSRDEAKITLHKVPDKPGIASAIFGPLADAGVNVDMIVQNVSEDGKTTDLTFTCVRGELARALAAIEARAAEIKYRDVTHDAAVAKVSIIGIGMRAHPGVASTMFRTLSDKGINIQVISTSEIKVSVLIAEEYVELAVRALHSAYELDAA